MKPNLRLKALLIEVVENQMKDNDPPITNKTFKRLVDVGYSEQQAKEKIAAVVTNYIYDAMADGKDFDLKSYEKDLKAIK